MVNVQALIGTTFGTCVLEKLIAQGDMGAVFFARQLNSQELVVVKILLASPSTISQISSSRADFLARLHREMTMVAALSHQHILPLYSYGEQLGFPYLVMPYVSGGSLADVLKQEGRLAMPRLLSYLEQIAAALDYAHGRGVVHYRLKPGNILLTSEGDVLVTDFAQVSMVAARQTSRMSLLRAGATVEALEYMAPEQLMGDVVDARTDIYALGCILYQVVTGEPPFQGATPMQLATMLVQASPRSPRSLRADLPEAAEQVLLHALAKRSRDRYARAQDFVHAFRAALAITDTSAANPPSNPAFKKRSRGLFDPVWRQTDARAMLALPGDGLDKSQPSQVLPEPGLLTPSLAGGLFRPTGLLSAMNTFAPEGETALGAVEQAKTQTTTALPPTPGVEIGPKVTRTLTTGALPAANVEQGGSGTVKLTGAMKVVQAPVAGQPGRYVTSLLPVLPATTAQEEAPARAGKSRKKTFDRQQKIVAVLLFVAVVFSTSGLFWFFHSRSAMPAKYGVQAEHLTPDLQAIAAARATATATANTILADPLTANIHNWPVSAQGSKLYMFENDGYHVINNDPHQSAPAILPDLVLKGPVVYALTMKELKGDDGSINNSFGMILRLSTRTSGSKSVVTFYCFEVVNNNGGKYEFVKYDSSRKVSSPWIPIWQQTSGGEFHQGPMHTNTFKLEARGKSFTFFVNGKRVGNTADGSLTNGEVGMLVNLKGTEVAFSNLLLTYS